MDEHPAGSRPRSPAPALDTSESRAADRLARLTSTVLDVPVAVVTFGTLEEQVVAGRFGTAPTWSPPGTTPVTHALFRQVVADDAPYLVRDARRHAPHARAPSLGDAVAATGSGTAGPIDGTASDRDAVDHDTTDVVAFCGVPIRDAHRRAVGALCAIDHQPRTWTASDLTRLELLADVVSDQIGVAEARRLAAAAAEQAAVLVETGAALGESERHLDQAKRTIDKVLSVVGHDVRAPISAALGLAQTLQDSRLTPEGRPEVVDALVRSLLRSNRLLAQLLEHGRTGTVEIDVQPVDLQVVLDGVLADLAPLLASSGLGVVVTRSLPTVHGDATMLGQLLANLVANAARYATRDRDRATLTIHRTDLAPGVHVTFTDDGPGFTHSEAEQLFLAGVRGLVDDDTHALGIGLATCQTIVERHDGRIWAEPDHPGGACIHVLLPAPVPAVRTVLVVEDNPDVQLLYRTALHEQLSGGSIRLHPATDLASGWERLEVDPLQPGDLALIDLHLPDGDPLTMIEHLVARGVQVHVITALHGSDPLARRAANAGARVSSKTVLVDQHGLGSMLGL